MLTHELPTFLCFEEKSSIGEQTDPRRSGRPVRHSAELKPRAGLGCCRAGGRLLGPRDHVSNFVRDCTAFL
ncbi:hypothetical protein CgunFtcFv8_011966 [Champsocephalus gunnari]|uniref:Uncharacterized protein n=1 Tax=Champsocephalus gunnari TaxID=52237 RepID=A0AAN8D7T5_CHAGU|nr:hypothetical protein CgunFtcFv8_011966 [Champsocephalus gunnari]